MSMKLIATTTLGADAANIEFTSIPQDGTDLVLLTSLRSDRAAQEVTVVELRLNGATTDRTSRSLQGSGTAASSVSYTNGRIALDTAADSTADTFGNGLIYIPNYAGSTNKSASVDSVSENNATEAYQNLYAFLWSQTAAITSVEVRDNLADFVAGSTISLYKITKGSDGIVTTS
jgi:hypothetical protein